MAKLVDSKEAESFGIELEEIGRSIRSSFRIAAASSRRSSNICFDHYSNGDGDGLHKERRVIDVAKLGALERRLLIENLIKHIDNDNLQLLSLLFRLQDDSLTWTTRLWKNYSFASPCWETGQIPQGLHLLAGVNGLSTEQRKRLTIAVELVSNPSIIFMDEPTSGLDARAAAIVMRAVKNVAETGRTVVFLRKKPPYL